MPTRNCKLCNNFIKSCKIVAGKSAYLAGVSNAIDFVRWRFPPFSIFIFIVQHITRSKNHSVVMTKNQIIRYLQRNKDILSIRAISENTGFSNLHKILNGQIDNQGYAFTFPDRHVRKVSKEIKRLQTISKL